MHIDELGGKVRVPGGRRSVESRRDASRDLRILRQDLAGVDEHVIASLNGPLIPRTGCARIHADVSAVCRYRILRVVDEAVFWFIAGSRRVQPAVTETAVCAPRTVKVVLRILSPAHRPLRLGTPHVVTHYENIDWRLFQQSVVDSFEPEIEPAQLDRPEIHPGRRAKIQIAYFAGTHAMAPGSHDEVVFARQFFRPVAHHSQV